MIDRAPGTKYIVAFAVYLQFAFALMCLDYLRIDVRYGQFDQAYSEMIFPRESLVAIAFAPVFWWSQLMPLVAATGVVFRIRNPPTLVDAVLILSGSILMILSISAYLKPLLIFTKVMGYPINPIPATWQEICGNAGLAVASIGFLVWSIVSARKMRIKPLNFPGISEPDIQNNESEV